MCYSPKYNGNEETGGGSSSPNNYGSVTANQSNEIITTTLPPLSQGGMAEQIAADASGSSGKRKGLKRFSLLYNSLIK